MYNGLAEKLERVPWGKKIETKWKCVESIANQAWNSMGNNFFGYFKYMVKTYLKDCKNLIPIHN